MMNCQSPSLLAATQASRNVGVRSRLYHLPPVATGTAFSETLTSYVARLAEAHSLQTGTLLGKVVAPVSTESWAARASGRGLDNIYKGSAAINGIGNGAGSMIAALEKLTLRSDLSLLTMSLWQEVLPTRGLIRRTRAWCPECYHAWRAEGEAVYDPLLWAIDPVTACLLHHRPLETACPHCSRHQRHLDVAYRPGFCSACGSWLSCFSTVTANPLPIQGDAHAASTMVASLLDLMGTAEQSPGRVNVAKSLATFVNTTTGGNSAAFARMVGVPKNTLWLWLQGTVLPELKSLLVICQALRVPLSAVLLPDQCPGTHITVISTAGTERTRPRRKSRMGIAEVARQLQESASGSSASPPSLAATARSLGHDPRFLRKHFPGLCRVIVHKHAVHIKCRTFRRRARR